MNITVFGANGQIGRQLITIALQNGDVVKAVVRRDGALDMTHPNLETIVVDYNNHEQMTNVIAGQDAVVSTLGPSLSMSRKVLGLPITKAHDMILRVMEEHGVKRLITLATPTLKSKDDKKNAVTIMPSIMAKILFPIGYAEMKAIEKLIHKSNVDWTVVRIINPNVNKDGNGYAISFGDTPGKTNVSRKNVAACMFEALRKDEWIGKMPIVYNK
ncbi:NAD(P)-dependent oxidoreductase [Lysinibacillus sp. NPDC056959]|uniref:NAD(P)-dependent oxidoreductase n=1 Tax=Lysinibacillus sp. NPDC056959 TaxID=3345981 RepID=UPI003626ADE4